MRATLHVVSEPGARRRLVVGGGQVARFGRTDWADYSFPDDASMADVHFVVECGEMAATLRDLGTGAATLLNGAPTVGASLRSGDRITAGRTTWLVELEDVPVGAGDGSEHGGEEKAEPTQAASEWIEFLTYLGVDEEALAVPQDGQTADDLVAALVAKEQFAAAAHLRAHQLQARAAVWWVHEAIAQRGIARLPAPQRTALAAVRGWVANPDESRRRVCEQQAVALGYKGLGGLLAAAAFFSGDNVAPPDCPSPTPPDPRLTGRLVTATLVIAVAQVQDAEPAAVWKPILAAAKQMLTGPISWPEPPPAPAA